MRTNKKFLILCMLVLMCTQLTGCGDPKSWPIVGGLFESYEEVVDGSERKGVQNNLTLVGNFEHSSATDKAAKKAQKAIEAQAAHENTAWWPPSNWIGINSIYKSVADRDVAKTSVALSNAIATDTTMQDSMYNNKDRKDGLLSIFDMIAGNKFIFIILGIAVCVGIILLLLHMRNKKKIAKINAKAMKHAQVVQVSDPAMTAVANKKFNKTAISTEGYQRMIAENCAKVGASPQALIEQNDGDLEKAYQQSNLLALGVNQ